MICGLHFAVMPTLLSATLLFIHKRFSGQLIMAVFDLEHSQRQRMELLS
jgi:hypothetical protein